jgi:hypothetical protein
MGNTSQCEHCSSLVPLHLHQQNRPEITEFGINEELYRRFPFKKDGVLTLKDGKPTASIFSTKSMSCNRSKHSQKPEDVLYDTFKKIYVENAGIASLCFCKISTFKQSLEGHTYTLSVKHKPEFCMYPHSEVIVQKDQILIEDFKRPESIKTAIKHFYRSNALIIKEPIEESPLV